MTNCVATKFLCRDTGHSCHDKDYTTSAKLCHGIAKLCHDIIQENSMKICHDGNYRPQ